MIPVLLSAVPRSLPAFPGRPTVEHPLRTKGHCQRMPLVMRVTRCWHATPYRGRFTYPPSFLPARGCRCSAPLTTVRVSPHRLTAGWDLVAVTSWTRNGLQWTTFLAQVRG